MENQLRIANVTVETVSSDTIREACRMISDSVVAVGGWPLPQGERLKSNLRTLGGWIVRDSATGRCIAAGTHAVPHVVDGRVHYIIELPVTEIAYDRLGLTCLLRVMALTALLLVQSLDTPLGKISIVFRGDQPPTLETIQTFGLCLMVRRQAAQTSRKRPDPRPIDIDLALLPQVCAAMLPLLGQSRVKTWGKNGCAIVHQGSTGTLFSKEHLPFIRALARGRLSLIGLEDQLLPKFG